MIPGLEPGARGLASPGQLHKGLNERIGVYAHSTVQGLACTGLGTG